MATEYVRIQFKEAGAKRSESCFAIPLRKTGPIRTYKKVKRDGDSVFESGKTLREVIVVGFASEVNETPAAMCNHYGELRTLPVKLSECPKAESASGACAACTLQRVSESGERDDESREQQKSDRRKALYQARRDALSAIFAARLRAWFYETGTVKADFARRCRMVDENLGAYLNGSRFPSAVILAVIARETRVSADYWLGLTDEPRRILVA